MADRPGPITRLGIHSVADDSTPSGSREIPAVHLLLSESDWRALAVRCIEMAQIARAIEQGRREFASCDPDDHINWNPLWESRDDLCHEIDFRFGALVTSNYHACVEHWDMTSPERTTHGMLRRLAQNYQPPR